MYKVPSPAIEMHLVDLRRKNYDSQKQSVS